MSLPNLRPCLPIETLAPPMMCLFRRIRPFSAEVQPFFRRFHFPIFDDGSHKDFVPPNNRRRPTHAGNAHFPGDILIGTPVSWKVPPGSNTKRVLAAKLRRIVLSKGAGDRKYEVKYYSFHCWHRVF